MKFGNSSKKVVAEEIIEDALEDDEPPAKTSRIEVIPPKTDTKKESWNRSIGVLRKTGLANLVKPQSKKSEAEKDVPSKPPQTTNTAGPAADNASEKSTSAKEVPKAPATGLSLLAAYSGSDSDSQ